MRHYYETTMKQLFIIIFISLFAACDNKHNTEELVRLDYKFYSTNFERNLIVVSDTLDTASINSSIRLEQLPQDISYSVYRNRDFCKIIKFDNEIPYYLYYAIMAEISTNNIRKRDCFIFDINKVNRQQSYLLRSYKPELTIMDKEFFYGKFIGGKSFVIDFTKLIDTSINNCTYEYEKTPLDKDLNKYLSNEYFDLKDLETIKTQQPSYSITVKGSVK